MMMPIFTARISSCGKVMNSQLSVSHSLHKGRWVCLGGAYPRGGDEDSRGVGDEYVQERGYTSPTWAWDLPGGGGTHSYSPLLTPLKHVQLASRQVYWNASFSYCRCRHIGYGTHFMRTLWIFYRSLNEP